MNAKKTIISIVFVDCEHSLVFLAPGFTKEENKLIDGDQLNKMGVGILDGESGHGNCDEAEEV